MSRFILLMLFIVSCGDALPDDLGDYRKDCRKLNAEPIPPYDGDPHSGFKNVYACNVPAEQLGKYPFPDGAMIVKESRKANQQHDWLIAVARKSSGQWDWDEYTRNFSDEAFRRILVPESKCSKCHQAAAATDSIFTRATPLTIFE